MTLHCKILLAYEESNYSKQNRNFSRDFSFTTTPTRVFHFITSTCEKLCSSLMNTFSRLMFTLDDKPWIVTQRWSILTVMYLEIIVELIHEYKKKYCNIIGICVWHFMFILSCEGFLTASWKTCCVEMLNLSREFIS